MVDYSEYWKMGDLGPHWSTVPYIGEKNGKLIEKNRGSGMLFVLLNLTRIE
jgi:hypothetical protein